MVHSVYEPVQLTTAPQAHTEKGKRGLIPEGTAFFTWAGSLPRLGSLHLQSVSVRSIRTSLLVQAAVVWI